MFTGNSFYFFCSCYIAQCNGLLYKPIGIQTIGLAAVEDIVVWIILAIGSAFPTGSSALEGLYTVFKCFDNIQQKLIKPIFKKGCFVNYQCVIVYCHRYLNQNEETIRH